MLVGAPSNAEAALFEALFTEKAEAILRARRERETQITRTLKPTVVVGLGGTGNEIAARLRRSLRRYYEPLGASVAETIQFVMLDTEPLAGQQSEVVKQQFTEAQYHSLGGFDPSSYLKGQLSQNADLRRWWDESYRVAAETINGCKRIRQLGRLCLYRSRVDVGNVLLTALNDARRLNAETVSSLGLPELADHAEMTFYVITGSCGGTGSGMFLDACHMIHRLARQAGLTNPVVRALILLPTLHVEMARHTYGLLAEAYQANAYAFFKEIQHFVLEGERWPEWCMDSEERKARVEEPLGSGWRPAARFYLMDNLVAGKVLTGLDDVYQLSSDTLFHIITTPVGINEDQRASTNVDMALNGMKDGRATAFSSLGVGYVLHPAKTIAQCAAAGYLRDLIRGHYTRALTPDEQRAAATRAEDLFANHGEVLDAVGMAGALAQPAERLAGNIPDAGRIEENAQRNRERGFYGAMEEAGRLADSLTAQAMEAQEQQYQQQLEGWLKQVDALIHTEIAGASESDSLEQAEKVLRELKERVTQADPAAAQRALSAREKEELCKKQVQHYDADMIPNVFQQGRIRDQVRTFASALKGRYGAEVAKKASDLAEQYRAQVVGRIESAVARCDRLLAALRAVGDALDHQAHELDPTGDERYLVATTQLVPGGGVKAASAALEETLRTTLAADAKDLLPKLAFGEEPASPAATSVALPGERLRAWMETLVGWALDRPPLRARLEKAVHQVGTEDPGEEVFRRIVLGNMLHLSDPTWELDTDRAGMGREDTVRIYSVAKPVSCSVDLLPTRLEPAARAAQPLDQHRIMVLQSEHAAPLHAVVGMDVLRGTYEQWVRHRDRQGDPAHLARQWNRGVGLTDVFPARTGVASDVVRSFALGNFSNWLIQEKEHAASAALVNGAEGRGYVYRRGPNRYFCMLVERMDGGALRRRGEQPLNKEGGRAAAMQNFGAECMKSGELYLDGLNSLIAWMEMKGLLQQYVDALQQQIDSATVPELARQLELEQEAIKTYLRSADTG